MNSCAAGKTYDEENSVHSGEIDVVKCSTSPQDGPRIIDFLSRLHPDSFIAEEALAKGFGKTARTVRRWEMAGILPPRTPGIKMWRVGNILSWLVKRTELEEMRAKAYQAQCLKLNE